MSMKNKIPLLFSQFAVNHISCLVRDRALDNLNQNVLNPKHSTISEYEES